MTNDRKPPRPLPRAAAWTALPGRTRVLIAGAGGIGVLLLIWVLSAGRGGGPGPSPSAPPSPVVQASGAASGVPAMDSCELLEFAELDEAMGLLDLPMEQRSIITFSDGEACRWINSRDGVDVEGLVVRIEPGSVDDFATGATLVGVTGTPTGGVGQLAVWFGGDRTGTLSVTAESSLGQLFFRVTIARPDLEADAILPLATKVSGTILPRFPGMSAAPRSVVIGHDPSDASADGYVDNLLVREAAGEWTREEGLIATLRLLVGEADAEDVLRHTEVADVSGSGLVALAGEYLAGGPQGAQAEEIERLLGQLLVTREELQSQAGAGGSGAVPAGAAILASVREPAADRVVAMQDEGCGGAPEPCVIVYRPPEIEELDALFGQERFQILTWSNHEELGWVDARLRWIAQALNRSVKTFTPLGRMPEAVTIAVLAGGATDVVSGGDAQSCDVNAYAPLQARPEGELKQRIAAELALCYQFATFPAKAHSESARWWRDGLAVYLSNVAYPAVPCSGSGTGATAVPQNTRCDLEWASLPAALRNAELGKSILDRSGTNAFFFQDLFWSGGNEGIRSLIDKLQGADDRGGQEAVLANHDDMPKRLNDYVVHLTDSLVQDSGAGFVPYDAPADEVQLVEGTRYSAELIAFGAARWHVRVPEGRKACLETIIRGDVQHSWRLGSPGPLGVLRQWEVVPAIELEEDAVFVFTTSQRDSEVSVESRLVDPDEECQPQPSPPDPGSGGGCPPIICEPSRFFRPPSDLPSWFGDLLE